MQMWKIDLHEWELAIILASGIALIALTVLGELVDRARVLYTKIRNFRKPDDSPGAGSPCP